MSRHFDSHQITIKIDKKAILHVKETMVEVDDAGVKYTESIPEKYDVSGNVDEVAVKQTKAAVLELVKRVLGRDSFEAQETDDDEE